MQSLEAVSNTDCCQIINIAEFGSRRTDKADRLERWLEGKIFEQYGTLDIDALNNPLIRIITKFRALTEENQKQLFWFAENRFERETLDQQLWNMLERQPKQMDRRAGWGMVENCADTLLHKQFENDKGVGGMS